MSDADETTTADTAADTSADTTADTTAERAAPAKSTPTTPASRARRIGGRPLPGPGKAVATDSTTTSTTTSTKTSTTAPKRPATRTAGTAGTAKPSTSSAEKAEGKREKGAAKPRRDAEQTLARLRWLPAGILGLAAITGAVLCVVLGHGVWWAKKSVSAERDQVLAAAKTCVGSITNYDYRKLPTSEQAGLACTTGTFQSQYKQAMDTVVAKLAPQTKTVQTFQVADAGVESVSSDGSQWVVLVYGQQAVTNAETGPSTPRLDILSAQVTMTKVDGQWRVAQLKRL